MMDTILNLGLNSQTLQGLIAQTHDERTTSDLWREVRDKGVVQTWNERAMWNEMRMSDRDLSDVTGYTYTFLVNGQTPANGWLGLFKRGEKVRLRFINAAAMTFFDVRIPGLKMTVVAADGQFIQPANVVAAEDSHNHAAHDSSQASEP